MFLEICFYTKTILRQPNSDSFDFLWREFDQLGNVNSIGIIFPTDADAGISKGPIYEIGSIHVFH